MSKKTYKGEVKLASGHSLILNTLRNTEKFQVNNDFGAFGLLNLGADDIMETYAQLSEQFGDGGGEVDLKNLPAIINPIYRGLSEVIVRKNFDPIDFSEPGVLKASMHKMKGQTVYTNHFAYVGNEVGSVKDVLWEKSYEVDGIKIPAGFNLHMSIDAASNPKLARGILLDPPSIHSNSVTVTFAWEQSHPKMEYHEFRGKVGTIGPDGKLIRRVVTEVTNYFETSLVSHGADPYAKQIRGGKIVTPEMSQTRDSFSLELGKTENFHFFSYKDSASFSDEVSLEGTIPATLINNNDNKTQLSMNKELAILLAALVGYSFAENVASLSDDDFSKDPANVEGLLTALSDGAEKLKAFPGISAQVEALTSEKATLETEKQTLTDENANLKAAQVNPDAASLAAYKAGLLAETLGYHTVINKNEVDENIKSTLEASSLEALKSFNSVFKAQMEKDFPNCCQSCGSQEVSRGAAKADDNKETFSKDKEHYAYLDDAE